MGLRMHVTGGSSGACICSAICKPQWVRPSQCQEGWKAAWLGAYWICSECIPAVAQALPALSTTWD